ncbi:Uncharacterised protein [Mycobacteroides abscessus]|nr:Uncharacterised protein [Mycobacteroides abscessus]
MRNVASLTCRTVRPSSALSASRICSTCAASTVSAVMSTTRRSAPDSETSTPVIAAPVALTAATRSLAVR